MKTYVNDWFIGRLHEGIEEAFYDFQEDNGVMDDGLAPELNDKLADAVDNLLKVMNECMTWQKQNS